MPRPECPRCGSALVVAALITSPSESVLELRSGTVQAGAPSEAVDQWFCRGCGHQWEAAAEPSEHELLDLARDTVTLPPETAPTVGQPAAANPAAELRGTREERGRTLAEVSIGTGIQERHLRALERGAPLEEFPAPAYARFYLREYAEYLRLDPAPLLREFEARHEPVDETPVAPPDTHRRPKKAGWGILAAMSVVAVVLIAVLPSVFRSDEEAAPITTTVATSPAHDSGHEPVTISPAREPDGVRAVLRLSEPSWVEAIADGEVLEASTLEPGTLVVYRASERLELTLGNADAVHLRVNGEPVATGAPDDVVHLDIRWQDGEVLTSLA